MKTAQFEITQVVEDKEIESAKERLLELLEELREKIPELIVNEIVVEPAQADGPRPLRVVRSYVH